MLDRVQTARAKTERARKRAHTRNSRRRACVRVCKKLEDLVVGLHLLIFGANAEVVALCACQSSVQTRIMTRLSPKCAAIYRYIMHACAETQDAVHQHQSGVSLPPRCLPRIPSLRLFPLLHATSPKQRSIQVTEVSPRHAQPHLGLFTLRSLTSTTISSSSSTRLRRNN